MSTRSLARRIADLPELLGEMLTARRDGLKALVAFTPLSRAIGRDPGQIDRQQRELVRLGRLLLALYPGPLMALARDIAMLAEGLGDESAFRSALGRAVRDAGRLEKRLGRRVAEAPALVDFHLSLMDFAAARRIAEAAAPADAALSADLVARIDAVERDVAAWRPVVDAAGQALSRRIAGGSLGDGSPAVTLHVPVAAFRANPRDYPGFREDIRASFRQIVAVLDEMAVPFSVSARLAKHGSPAGPGRTISYHTIGGAGPALHVKETDRRSFFSGDAGGYSGWAAFGDLPLPAGDAHDRDRVAAFIASERAALIAANQSKYGQPDVAEERPPSPRPYVFVALQVIDDAVQRQASLHMFDMLEEVVTTCRARGVDVVVKRHPLCRSAAVRAVLARGVKRGLFSVAQGSIHGLIAGSCAVCVANSGVGAEALLHGKPVYTFGRAEYQAATFQVRRRGEFADLFEPDRLPAPIERIEDFVYALRHVYSVNVRDENRALDFWRARIRELLSR